MAARLGAPSWSQEGEDRLLARHFGGQRGGFYVDFGAHHPFRFSNTRLLWRRGWSGINIDAMPGSMAAFRRARPRNINLEIGIAQNPGSARFYIFSDNALNTFDAELAESYNRPPWQLKRVVARRSGVMTRSFRHLLRERLVRRPALGRVAIDTSWLLGDKLIRLGAGLLINAWVARYLGPGDFGLLSYALALTTILGAIATVGLPEILVRELVRDPTRGNEIMASAFILRLTASAIVVALAIGIVAIARPHEERVLLLVTILTAGQIAVSLDVIDQRYQAASSFRTVIVQRNISFVVFALLRVGALMLKASLPVFAALLSFELVAVGALLVIRARADRIGLGISNARIAECRRLVAESWPMLLRLLAIGIYLRLDQVIIGQLLGNSAVGIYAAAARTSEIWNLTPVAVMAAVAPRFTAIHHKDHIAYERHLTYLMRALVVAAVIMGVVLSIEASTVIAALYGASFVSAAPVLVVQVWAGVFVALGITANSWLINMGLLRTALNQAVGAAAASVILNLILIPKIGIVGAAVSVIISQALSGLFLNAAFVSTRPLFYLQCRALGIRVGGG